MRRRAVNGPGAATTLSLPAPGPTSFRSARFLRTSSVASTWGSGFSPHASQASRYTAGHQFSCCVNPCSCTVFQLLTMRLQHWSPYSSALLMFSNSGMYHTRPMAACSTSSAQSKSWIVAMSGMPEPTPNSHSNRLPVLVMSPCSMKYKTACRSIGVHSVFSRKDQLWVTRAFVQSTPSATKPTSPIMAWRASSQSCRLMSR